MMWTKLRRDSNLTSDSSLIKYMKNSIKSIQKYRPSTKPLTKWLVNIRIKVTTKNCR